jgi:hypothetical protein
LAGKKCKCAIKKGEELTIEGRKGKGGDVVGALRVHGGEESLVLELVRVAAAATTTIAGPPIASHSAWLWQTPLLAHLPAKPNPALTFSLSPAMGRRRGGRVTRAEAGGSEGRGGKSGGVTDFFSSIYPFISLLYLGDAVKSLDSFLLPSPLLSLTTP